MNFVITPGYKDLFDEKNKHCPKELIKDIPTSVILQLITWLGGIMHIHPYNFEKTEFYFVHWLGAFPEDEKKRLYNLYMGRKKMEPEKAVTIFSQVRNLHFINFCLQNYKEGERSLTSPDSVTKTEEVNILKAYLLIADENEPDASKPISDSRNYTGLEKFYIGVWPVFINQYAFESRTSFVIQSIQSLMFFQFAEKFDKFKKYILEFYNDIGVNDGTSYIYHIWDAYIGLLNKENPGFRIKVDLDKGIYNLLNTTSINVPSIDSNLDINKEDFTSLRTNPVFKVNKDEFCILNYNFFTDKIYEGVKFDFYNRAQEKNYLGTFNSEFKSFGNFKTQYSTHFSEKTMFYKIMDYSYEHYKHLTKVNGGIYDYEYSDYYLREGNNLFLFEFKDIIINSKIKYSNDGLKIKNEIDKQLIKMGDQKKGILQLIDVIKKINESPFEFDNFQKKKIKSKNVSVYPIIVLTDEMFDFPGINNYLNQKIKELLIEEEIELKVQGLTLISLNTLFDISSHIRTKEISFKDLIISYLKNSKSRVKNLPEISDIFTTAKALRTFREYTNKYLDAKKIKPSKRSDLFNDVIQEVFRQQNKKSTSN